MYLYLRIAITIYMCINSYNYIDNKDEVEEPNIEGSDDDSNTIVIPITIILVLTGLVIIIIVIILLYLRHRHLHKSHGK